MANEGFSTPEHWAAVEEQTPEQYQAAQQSPPTTRELEIQQERKRELAKVAPPVDAPPGEQVEVGIQRNTRETVSKEQFDQLNKQAPILADILKREGFKEYEKARPEFEASYAAQITNNQERERQQRETAARAEQERRQAQAEAKAKQYEGWTAEELVTGKVKDGVFIPPPYGMKGGTYVPPPKEVQEQLFKLNIPTIGIRTPEYVKKYFEIKGWELNIADYVFGSSIDKANFNKYLSAPRDIKLEILKEEGIVPPDAIIVDVVSDSSVVAYATGSGTVIKFIYPENVITKTMPAYADRVNTYIKRLSEAGAPVFGSKTIDIPMDRNAFKTYEMQGKVLETMNNIQNSLKTYIQGIYEPYVEAVKSDKPVAEKAAAIGLHTADLLVPGVWARHWNDMTWPERYFNIAMDSLFVATVFGGKLASLGRGAAAKAAAESVARNSAEKTAIGTQFRDIEIAFKNGNPERLQLAGRELRLLGERMQVEGADARAMIERGAFIEGNADDLARVIKVTKEKPPDSTWKKDLQKQADTLEKDLDAMRRAEQRTSREGLKEVLKEKQEITKRQVEEIRKKIAVDTEPEVKTILESWTEQGTRPLTKTEKAPLVKVEPKAPAAKPKTTPAVKPVITVKGEDIPLEKFATKPKEDVAREYKVTPREITRTVTKLSPKQQSLFDELVKIQEARELRQIQEIQQRTRGKTLPRVLPLKKTIARTRTQTETRIQTKTQPKTLPKVSPQAKTKIKPQTKTRTKTLPRIIPRTKISLKEKPRPKFPDAVMEKRVREYIKASGGAIAWRQGKVGKKDRWDTIINPYSDNSDYVMILGDPPEGATIVRRGKGSARATAQMLRGTPPKRKVLVDSGFQDINVTPDGRTIQLDFTPDPKLETTGDITIGERRPRIGAGRGMRLTPRTPRLR